MKKGFIEGAVFAGLACALVIGGAFAAGLLRNPPTSTSEWAAWVQAVGSVIAIAAAVWLPYHQRQLADRVALHAQATQHVLIASRVRTITAEMSILFLRLARTVKSKSEVGEFLRYDPLMTTDLLERIAQLETQEFYPERATILFDARNLLLRVHTMLNGVERPWSSLTDANKDRLAEYASSADGVDRQAAFFLRDAHDLANKFVTVTKR